MTSEVEVARHIVDWLKAEGWTTYEEVAADGWIADIVAVRGPTESWVIECKLAWSQVLLTQATRWIGQATMVSVAVLRTKNNHRRFRWHLDCLDAGIGEFLVDDEGEVAISLSPKRRRVQDQGIRASLNEAQKHFAEAGNAKGERWSPFQEKAHRLIAAVKANPGLALSDFVNHDAYAIKITRRQIQQGAIRGIILRSGKLYEEGWDHHSVARTKKKR